MATVIWKAQFFYIHHETWNRLLHRIHFINQKSYSSENLSSFPLSHPVKFPRHLWPLSDIFQLRRLTFCRCYKVPLWKKPAVKTTRGTCRARRHARGHKLQRSRHRVGLLVNLYSFVPSSKIPEYTCMKLIKATIYHDDLSGPVAIQIFSANLAITIMAVIIITLLEPPLAKEIQWFYIISIHKYN